MARRRAWKRLGRVRRIPRTCRLLAVFETNFGYRFSRYAHSDALPALEYPGHFLVIASHQLGHHPLQGPAAVPVDLPEAASHRPRRGRRWYLVRLLLRRVAGADRRMAGIRTRATGCYLCTQFVPLTRLTALAAGERRVHDRSRLNGSTLATPHSSAMVSATARGSDAAMIGRPTTM